MFPLGVVNQQTLGNGGGSTLLTDLIAWYDFNETSGNRSDSHGSATLLDQTTTGYADGIIGNAINCQFDYLKTGTNPGFIAGDNDWSIAFFAMPRAIGYGTPSNDIFLSFGLNSGTSASNYNWMVGIDGNYNTVAQVNVGSTFYKASKYVVYTAGGWKHFYCQYDSSSGKVGIAIDNGLLTETIVTGTPNSVSNPMLVLGAWAAGIAACNNARFDLMGFWSRLLSSDERSEHYNSGSGVAYADL
jgi:hypothetical protein